MNCFYINLDKEEARRASLEANFQEHAAGHWRLSRFPAVDTAYVHFHNVPGKIRPAEKACYLSHKSLIGSNVREVDPIFILEDDVVFGRRTCEIVDTFLREIKSLDWDILFSDICVPQATTMVDLIQLRSRLSAKNEVNLLNLANFPFAGAAGYIVNPNSRMKIFELLEAQDVLDVPYDLYLRQLIVERKLAGYTLFPFVTSLSDLSESSQTQPFDQQEPDLLWNTFRRMVWIDRDLGKQLPVLEFIDRELCDEESRLFGALFVAMASEKFRTK